MRLILLFSLISIGLHAIGQQQGRDLQGVVKDTSGVALEGVNVHLFSAIDTMSVITDENGRFLLKKIIASEFNISYSLIGYQLLNTSYLLSPLLPNMEVVQVVLKPQLTVLKDVNIYGILPIVIKEDTIQYNARAYKPHASEFVEEMMKRFPGIEINRNGIIKAQGQVVTRLKVNGKEFFSGDVLTATRNLPADIVENIQIIDDYGEHAELTGVKNTTSEKVININIKKDRNRGMFGQVTAGVGTDYHYIGSAAANSFNESQQISVLGSINNTSASLFSYGDVSGGGVREKTGADLSNMIDIEDGVNRANSIGINFRDALTDNTNIYGSYVFTDRENSMESLSYRETPYKNNTVYSDNLSNTNTQSNLHRLNWNIETKLDSSMFLKVSPTLSYSEMKRFSNNKGVTKNRRLTTEQYIVSEEQQKTPTLDLDAIFNKSFAKPGRNLSISLLANFNTMRKYEEINDDRLNIDSTYLVSLYSKRERLNQAIDNRFANNQLSFQASYIEPITVNSFLELNYDFGYSSDNNNRRSIDVGISGVDSLYSDSLNLKYSYKYKTNKIGFLYQYNSQQYTYQVGLGFQPARLSGYTLNREIYTSAESINFIPTARFTYKVNQLSSFSLLYKGQSNQPDFYQIQPIVDNSNPQSVIIGNPELEPEFSNDFSLQYRNFNLVSGNTFFSNLSFKGIKNKIVTSRSEVPNSTTQETRFLNTTGYFDMHAYYLYSLNAIDEVLSFNISSSTDYNNNISFKNQEKNKGRNLNFMQTLQVNYKIDDWLNVDLRGSYGFNRLRNSLPGMFSSDINTFSMGIGSKTYLNDWALSFDIAKRINKGYVDFVNTNPTLLNLYIERSFGKNDRAILRLQGFDLLNQNTGITNEVNGAEIYYIKNNRIGRYLLLSFNLRLQKFPHKTESK